MRLICVVASVISLCSSPLVAQPQQGADVPCNVTASSGALYGNQLLSVSGLRSNGTVVFRPGGAGFQTRDGFLVMKFGWTLNREGTLQVTGHRLDADAPRLRAAIGSAIEPPNFKPSYLIFPTPGCWEVTAQISDITDSKLTFITRVVKVGEGPAGRLDPQ